MACKTDVVLCENCERQLIEKKRRKGKKWAPAGVRVTKMWEHLCGNLVPEKVKTRRGKIGQNKEGDFGQISLNKIDNVSLFARSGKISI